MFISAEFYDELCPSYKKVIKELDDCIVKLQSDTTEDEDTEELQQKTFKKFSANYLMPKEYWVIYESTEGSPHDRINIREKGLNHFFFDRNLEPLPFDFIQNNLKLLNFTGHRSDKLMQSIYPHSHLKECYQIFERNLTCPPSKNIIMKYEEMKQLYQKIKASKNNVIEWFENLLEVGDTEFVIHNVEYRIGGNLLDKNLWKIYIKFLETADTNKMLEVYSKYCRFFLDDFEMKKEYKAKVEKYGPVFVEWGNLFDFEEKVIDVVEENSDDSINEKQVGSDNHTHTETVFQQSKHKNDEIQKVPSIDKNLLKKFFQNYQNQIFPFQKPFIEYILENANAAVWRNLYQTCKYFYGKKNVPICYKLEIEY